ncbi:MAG: glycosyltransferase family 4 protein [Ignavibacteriae bacterium]|nr:glycosyltransferase [Ignavibacteriota bacterium]NOG99440.1 glycosyltransferase family 4 protein [Ignavibacteriota bacterium]
MKILELTRLFYPSLGGIEKFVDDRLKIYQHLKYNFKVITTTQTERQISGTTKNKDVTYLKSFSPYEITFGLKRVLKSDYDILSVNQFGYHYADYAIMKAFRAGKKIVVTPHYLFHTDRYAAVKNAYSKFLLPSLLKKIDRIICFTQTEKEYWIKSFPFTEKKLSVIPHYFKPANLNSVPDNSDREYYFLYLGRGAKNKRIDLLIKAFNSSNLDYGLYLTIYEDELSDELNTIVKSNAKIKLLGRIKEEEKHLLLSKCSALILPTDFEAFGIVCLEASFYEKPILCSSLSVLCEILDDRGVLFFNNDIKSISNSLIKLGQLNKNERAAMGKINKENLQKYNFEKVVDLYSELFKSL